MQSLSSKDTLALVRSFAFFISSAGEPEVSGRLSPGNGVWGSRKARGDAESVRGRRPPGPPVMDHSS